jgi:RNA recognition motif-containing protein
MGIKLYVGNLGYGIGDSDLEKLFSAYGSVRSAQVIKDRDTGRSKGFGFVEMDNGEAAQTAISALNGKEVEGRALVVNEARPKEGGAGKGGFGGRGGGGFGGGKRY